MEYKQPHLPGLRWYHRHLFNYVRRDGPYDWCLWFVDIPRGPRLEQVFSIPKGALIGADLWIRPQKKKTKTNTMRLLQSMCDTIKIPPPCSKAVAR